MTHLIAPNCFSSEQQAKAYIRDCEQQFTRQVVDLTDRLLGVKHLRWIGLSGPTCSGKTTAADILTEHFQMAGRRVHPISVDNFFKEQRDARDNARKTGEQDKIDFDSIDALDLDLFARCLSELMTNHRTMLPVYDLSTGHRDHFEELQIVDSDDVLLFEGIQVVYPEVDALLRQHCYQNIFIHVGQSLQVGEAQYAPEEIRLFRRLVRDYYFRSSSAEFTLYLWDSVRDNEKKSILPYADRCDAQLNSLMGYEIGMLRPHLEKVLAKVPQGSAYRDKADAILQHVHESMAQPLSNQWLPSHALYREFVSLHS